MYEQGEAEMKGAMDSSRRSQLSYVSMAGVQPAGIGCSFKQPPIQIAIYDIDKESVSSVSICSKSASQLVGPPAKKKKRSSSFDFPRMKGRQTLLVQEGRLRSPSNGLLSLGDFPYAFTSPLDFHLDEKKTPLAPEMNLEMSLEGLEEGQICEFRVEHQTLQRQE